MTASQRRIAEIAAVPLFLAITVTTAYAAGYTRPISMGLTTVRTPTILTPPFIPTGILPPPPRVEPAPRFPLAVCKHEVVNDPVTGTFLYTRNSCDN